MEKKLYDSKIQNGNYNFLMGFPNCKSFALSSLGYMWLYRIADLADGINAEIICTDYNTEYRAEQADAISFSLSFDFDFMGVFEILDRHGIPFLSYERDDNSPLIFAGGPVLTTNPEPYKDIFDFIIIGDGEDVFKDVLNILKLKLNKKETLKELSKLDCVYIPYLTSSVKKCTVKLNNIIYTPIISDESYFKDTFIIEVARGCSNRCAFCTASYINLPFRSYEYKKIIDSIELGLKYTNKIALLGAQISAHPDFYKIMDYIRNKIENGQEIELGISSLRTDAVTPELIKTLVMGGQKTSTIAIEAASEKLRKFINKNLKNEQIYNAVKISKENGLKGLKIYSMIGIPEETQDDIDEFISLAKNLKEDNKGFKLEFSFSSFVPKPQTPFQWCKREETNTLEKKQKYLEKALAKIGIESKFSSIKWDYWQTVLSRGGSELTPLLIKVYKNGGKLGAYKSAAKELNIALGKYIQEYPLEANLDWDFINNFVSKEQLISEYKRLNRITFCKEL